MSPLLAAVLSVGLIVGGIGLIFVLLGPRPTVDHPSPVILHVTWRDPYHAWADPQSASVPAPSLAAAQMMASSLLYRMGTLSPKTALDKVRELSPGRPVETVWASFAVTEK